MNFNYSVNLNTNKQFLNTNAKTQNRSYIPTAVQNPIKDTVSFSGKTQSLQSVIDKQEGAGKEVLSNFKELTSIPSPSMSEQKVAKWILGYCKENNIKNAKLDDYGNVHIRIPATDPTKKPLLMTGHMDVVGDFSPVKQYVDGDLIRAKGRTLGADDKTGVSAALTFAKELSNDKTGMKHGGLEVVFTRDEEDGMTGAKNLDTSDIHSKYVLVLDGEKLGEINNSGASYLEARIHVEGLKGGHSGTDIGDKSRLNASKLMTELVNDMPQGVTYSDETGVITSCNLGSIVAGDGVQKTVSDIIQDSLKNGFKKFLDLFKKQGSTEVDENQIDKIVTDVLDESSKKDGKEYLFLNHIADHAATNVINTKAQATYSIRSADTKKEEELKNSMQEKVDKFNEKYKGLAKADIEYVGDLQAFEKNPESKFMEDLFMNSCKKQGIDGLLTSFHAGAETHVYAYKTNAEGEKLVPLLTGIADINNMHSPNESVDYNTMVKGYDLIKQVFEDFNA